MLALAFALALIVPAQSADPKRSTRYTLEGGVRLFTHYTSATFIRSQPTSYYAEGALTIWYKDLVGFYGLYGQTYDTTVSVIAGGGIRFPFLALKLKFLDPIRLVANADFVHYSYVTDQFVTFGVSEWQPRIGAGVHAGLFGSGLIFDVQLMASVTTGGFYLVPFAGVGLEF